LIEGLDMGNKKNKPKKEDTADVKEAELLGKDKNTYNPDSLPEKHSK
jgi:hypothetical protein